MPNMYYITKESIFIHSPRLSTRDATYGQRLSNFHTWWWSTIINDLLTLLNKSLAQYKISQIFDNYVSMQQATRRFHLIFVFKSTLGALWRPNLPNFISAYYRTLVFSAQSNIMKCQICLFAFGLSGIFGGIILLGTFNPLYDFILEKVNTISNMYDVSQQKMNAR